MAHSSEVRWTELSNIVSDRCRVVLDALLGGETEYEDLLEIWDYAGSGTPTDQAAADLLFSDVNSGGTATADQVSKVADLKAAVVALHELYVALNGSGATTQEDRAAKLRRMS